MRPAIDAGMKTEDALPQVACEVTREVLETMFFTTAEPVSCRHPEPRADWIAAMIRFEGAPCGQLRVMLSRALAVAVACGFLGIDPDEVTRDEENQVARELANMICGAMLSRLHPDSRVALEAPETIPAVFDATGGTHQCMETPEGMLAISMVTDR